MNTQEFDVVVVGGGPAGSTSAALVAMQGHRVCLLEKETFPRYQVGESLLPSTIHGICRLLGVTDEMARAGFTTKLGGTFRWGSNPAPWTFTFSGSSRMGDATSSAYQVERMKFDQILLDNARRRGVEVRENCSVAGILEADGRVCGVRYVDAARAEHQLHARYVIDASGNKSRIHDHVGGTRQYSEYFRNLALFGYFEGGKRLPGASAGNILTEAFESGWFWYIPLRANLTSVGAVVRRDLADKVRGDPEEMLARLIKEAPMVSDLLSDATRVTTGPYGQLRVRKDYSFHQTRFWRPGMVLVGDAACFVDPVFSSGVHLATYSALLAARSINSVMAGTVDEQVAFREFEMRYRREFGVFYEFLTSFYNTHEDERSYFWKAMKVTNSSRSDLEAFIDLVGGVSSGESALSDAESVLRRFESGSAEFDESVSADNLTRDEHGNLVPAVKPQVFRQTLQEGLQVQEHALRASTIVTEAPLFDDGLVSSPDGMFWLPAS
jgi:halogenation protein CepH